MPDTKTSALTALAAASVAADDLFPIADTSATTTKSIRVDNMLTAAALRVVNSNFLLGAATAGTSGTGVVGIPTGVQPTTAPADEVQLYSKDYEAGAGDARLHVTAESGNPVALGNGTVGVPKPAATTGASVAGRSITVAAGAAVASTDTAGAAAGGDVVLSPGAAARFTSGNAAGGNIIATPGAGIGTGAAGTLIVRQPGGTPGTSELQISHDGSNAKFVSRAGSYNFYDPADGTTLRAQIFAAFSGIFAAANGYECGSGSQGAVSRSFTTTGLDLTTTDQVTWRSGNFGTKDVGLVRTAAGVSRVTDGSTGNGWLQQSGGHKSLDAGPTSVSNTFANSNLAWTLVAGRTYSINLKISGGNSTAAEGAKFTLASDGTLTATTFDLAVVGTNGTVVAGTTRITSLGGTINYTTFTTTSDLWLVGEIKVNVGGVLTLQYATNAHSAGTLTVSAGTWGKVNDMLAV